MISNWKLFFFLIIFFPALSWAQLEDSDFTTISNHLLKYDKTNIETHSIHLQKSSNPIKAFLFFPLFFYQKFISEQISAGCEFQPTCSNFGIQAIREFGFIKGICITADRLTRCNGQAQTETEGYLLNHSNGKIIDEPSMYHFKD